MPDSSSSPPAPAVPPQWGLGLGLLAVSTASIIIRFAQNDGAASLAIAAYRLTLASLFALPLALPRFSCAKTFRRPSPPG